MLGSRSSHRRSRILTSSEVIQRQERVMDHGDPSPWRRLSGPEGAVPEEQAGGERARRRGLRHVRRLSNWTAAGLVAATAVTAGYFARAGTGASAQQAASVSGSPSQAPASSSNQACTTAVTTAVTAPVAVSGGSGVTATVPAPSRTAPVPGQTCAPGTAGGAPPTVVYQERHEYEHEKGDS
jgi:hypothetical protein